MLSNDLLVMAEFDGSKTLEEIYFSFIPIWIWVTKLPLGLMSREAGEVIGDEIGEFMEVDVGEDGMVTGSVPWVKIRLDIWKPLMHGVMVQTEEEGPDRWCSVMYEYLSDFCYVCGIIGHTERACFIKLKKGEVAQFGKDLRFRPARKWNDGGNSRESEMAGGGARGRGAYSGRWGSDGGSSGGLSRSDVPSWRQSGSRSKESGDLDGTGEKEVTSPMKALLPPGTTMDLPTAGSKEGKPAESQVNSTLQSSEKGDGADGHDALKEPALKDDKKKSLKTFKGLPRSDNENDDKMEIDVKKQLFSLDEGFDSKVSKKLKSSDGSKLEGMWCWVIR